jgi:succinate dehydrogenase flavin-adding protein (antitoxin of CptAB toxin-antitoxin module)
MDQFEGQELQQFEALVSESDADLMDWISGRVAVPNHLDGPVFKLLVKFKNRLTET